MDITEAWDKNKTGIFNPPLNKRQLATLELWGAWLSEGENDFDTMVVKVPDFLTELYEMASNKIKP